MKKYRADTLKLNAMKEEDAKRLQMPKQEVYRDQKYSPFSYSSQERSDYDKIRILGLGRKGTIHCFKKHYVNIWRRKASSADINREETPSMLGKKQHNDAQRDQSIPSSPSRTQNDHALQLLNRRDLDETVTELKDQQIMAMAYLSFARTKGHIQFGKKLKQRIKDTERVIVEINKRSKLTRRGISRMRYMRATLSKASQMYPDCSEMAEKLQEMTQDVGVRIQAQRKKTMFLTQLFGRTTSKSMHCLSMRLTAEYFAQQLEELEPANQLNLYNPDLLHYVVFSDNVLACAVVVNSTVSTAKEPEKIVFHVVTDSLNFHGMSMWFQSNPPRKATIQVKNAEHIKSLLAKYEPITVPNMDKKYSIDPRYSSMLNQLGFFLPEIFPHLDKIVFLEHDVVVLKDLSPLWSFDMKGKVNAAVHTCHDHQPLLVNFSDPSVVDNLDLNTCTWSFGMNVFDLKEWRDKDLSSKYLLMDSKKNLWKPGSLFWGWMTSYNHRIPLDASWLVSGLGHDTSVSQERIQQAAVIHYDGIMKPWFDIRINRYKDYWTKHINFDHPYLQECNIIRGFLWSWEHRDQSEQDLHFNY
ncbi:hypothetical protein V2J09_015637 [Rumex salicifolius]